MSLMLDRRTLIRGGLLAGVSSLLPGSGLAAPAEATSPLPVRLGIASYTFRTFDEARLIAAMLQLQTTLLNVKDVHLPMVPLDAVASRAARYRAAGLTLTAVGTIYFTKEDEADVRAKFEYCKAAGIRLIVGAPTHKTLAMVERFAKEYDMRVAIHNHGPEDKEWPSPLDVLAGVKGMDARMGCCMDVGHAMRAGTDVVGAVHTIGPRLFDVHMKDLANASEKESQVAVGRGVMPVRGIFEALIATKYAGVVDLEYEIHADDPMPGVIESMAYMRGVLAGMIAAKS